MAVVVGQSGRWPGQGDEVLDAAVHADRAAVELAGLDRGSGVELTADEHAGLPVDS